MKKFALALSTALLALNLAYPAAAFVNDRQDLVPAADEKKLEAALKRIKNHRFEVLFVPTTTGAPSALAKKAFGELGLGEKDGVIVVAVESKKVGVHVGQGFTRRGVSDQVVSQRIQADFLPHAKQGQYARGAAALAEGLVEAGAKGKSTGGNSGSSDDDDALFGGILLLIFVGGPIGGFLIWRWAKKTSLADTKGRLDALRPSHELIQTGSIKLAEIDELAKYQQGDVQKAYQQLGKASHKTLERARAFGEKFEAAETALKAKKTDEADKDLNWLDREATTLGADVSASLTALEQLEAGGLTGAQALEVARLPVRVQDISRRLADVTTLVTRESERGAAVSVKPLPKLVSALEEAHARLRQQPIDVEGAEARLKEAEKEAEKLTGYVDIAEERHREQERIRAEEARDNVGNAVWTAAAISSLSHNDHHHHDSGSSWGSSSDSSWDSGSSSDDSWGSDSGSSSDDSW